MQPWKKIVVLIATGVFVLSACQSSTFKGSSRVPIDLRNSEISFIGDDSFITRREAYEPPPRDRLWREILYLDGGWISYTELDPAYSYGAGAINHVPTVIMRNWYKLNKFKSHRIGMNFFKRSTNSHGAYEYVVKGNTNETCASAGQFFGVGELMGDAWGKRNLFLYLCWPTSRGSADELENFVLKLMKQWRADEGRINKIKAASK